MAPWPIRRSLWLLHQIQPRCSSTLHSPELPSVNFFRDQAALALIVYDDCLKQAVAYRGRSFAPPRRQVNEAHPR